MGDREFKSLILGLVCSVVLTAEHCLAEQITYHGRISRLMNQHCVECHREDGVAPFGLESYEQVVANAPMIREVIRRKVMPPWFAAPPSHGETNLWSNDRSLSEDEISDLFSWIEGGQLVGDVAEAPEPLSFPADWSIGTPDAVFAFEKPVPIQASGFMPYKNIVIETDLNEDKWVKAMEVLPGDRRAVHHVLVFVLPPEGDLGGRRDGINYWGIYVPGNGATVYPDGYARLLPKGSRLRFQMHYTPFGSATEDLTSIGMIFSDQPPKHEVRTASILNTKFRIPPGAENHEIEASIRLPADVEVLGYLPHHHLRGKACRYDLLTAGAKTETLLDIPRYDFNWQLFYQYAEPRILKDGSTIRFTAWYDNSADNPANPDPAVTVKWGQQTHDEMHIGYVEYTVVGARPGEH